MKFALRQHKLLGPAVLVSAAILPLLSGCSGFNVVAPTTGVTQQLNLSGSIHGGQQPISGAKVYLYSVGTYAGAPSTSMLTGAATATDANGNGYVTSNANGGFTITGDYTCPTSPTGIQGTTISTYLLALGGNPGLATGTSNSAISLVAALGSCANLSSSTFINISEVSTVAAVTALQQFTTDATDIADPAIAAQPSYGSTSGIPNAMLTVNAMVNLGTGLAMAAPQNSAGVAPQQKLNTLGNALAACVNTAAPSSTQCAALFSAATATGATAPADTFAAMLAIAKNPGRNVAQIYALSSATGPFQPTLTAAPNDFTLGITYTANVANPNGIAIDNSGNVFVANCPTCVGAIGVDSVARFSPAGVATTGTIFTTGIHKPTAIALDRYNSVWVTEATNGVLGNQVTRVSNDGGTLSTGFPVALSGVPGGMALIENGPASAWITDTTNGRMTLIKYDGTQTSALNTTGLTAPTAIAADGIENLYLIGNNSTSVLKYSPVYDRTQTGGTLAPSLAAALTSTTIAGASSGLSTPSSLAIDGGDHLWTIDATNQAVSEIFAYNGTATSPSAGYTGINVANTVTIDGAGTAWIANCRTHCSASGSSLNDNVVHLSAAGVNLNTSTDGIQNGQLNNPTASAIDSSGNLWITNTGGSSVTELVGVAVPVILELETASSRHALPAVNYLKNPSFEIGGKGTPPYYTLTGTAGTVGEDNGSPFSGQQKLTFYNGAAFNTTISQAITGLTNGNYLATCYIAAGPGSTTRTTSINVTGYGGTALTNAPTDLTYTFQPYSILVPVTNGTLTLGLQNNETYTTGGYAGFDSCSVTKQ